MPATSNRRRNGKEKAAPAPAALLDQRGLPCNLDVERYVLGSILLDDAHYLQARAKLDPDDFALEKHRRILARMDGLAERQERIDRVTVANELMRYNELEACDGLSYLVSLDDGLPQILNLDSYLTILKEKATMRKLAFAGQNLMSRAILEEEQSSEIISAAATGLLDMTTVKGDSMASIRRIIDEYPGGLNALCTVGLRRRGCSPDSCGMTTSPAACSRES